MEFVAINGWAVLAAVVSSFVVGGVWYSPAVFLNQWLEMAGVEKAKFNAGLPRALFGDLIASIVMALVLDQVLVSSGAVEFPRALLVTFLLWLAFVASVLLNSVTYEQKPVRYFAINAGYRLVAMMIMGTVLTLWR